ncbi:MAG: carbohydrate ABC transporter permease [Bacteroidota bacterium]|nr:carbohydrate ABC transporter permease [Bacteroidota bacterium]MDP4234121.1 carbohydrate ABC transporter permease [Bacteroidota bacterium]MDP4243062.1 carbohydrate ABC transporter permease [Bacteroidota bacterium]MDP4287488.1 carbohydrate ABC transporter permease [Bacteroidota bacterium]
MKLLRYILLGLTGVLILAPFLWMIATSLETPETLTVFPPRLLPAPPRFSNYSDVFQRLPIGQFFYNSVKISVLGTIGELFAASLAAFAFARMEFRGKNWLFAIVISTMMIPFQVTMVPVYIIMRYLGWLDSHASLIIPHFFGGAFATGAFGVFLLRQFFESIPKELEDASRIDGASRFRFFLTILLPLSKPALAVLGLFVFMGIWNDLLSPVLFLSSEDKMPLTFGLAVLQTVQHNFRFDLLMAGTLIAVVPIILLYIFTQRFVSEAFLRSGVKG